MDIVKDKPSDWPANAIECQLSNIYEYIEIFKKEPNYKNKEILVSLISDYDLNQRSTLGLCRTTEYEVAILNTLYLESHLLNLNALRTYLYELVGYKTRMQKMLSWLPEANESMEINEFEGLIPELKLYYLSYQKFTIEKSKDYSEQLIELVENIIDIINAEETKKELITSITHSYISLLNDISYFRCVKRTRIWAFKREEIYSLYKLASKLIRLDCDNPIKRPLKGVLMTSISNYVLKSRNNYNEDYICKYISSEVAAKSIKNHQIWISPIEKLNDIREQKIIPELYENTDWCDYAWVKNIDLSSKRQYYVSSFCKTIGDKNMINNYGNCIYGYKDDRMAEILSPIICNENKEFPSFSQVMAFDVIYDKEEAIKELNFLCSIIDCFDIDDKSKNSFLEEIMQYWILSIKDPQWSYEKERRYVLFMYKDYEYKELDLSDPNYLKIKSSLFIHPDFILGANPVKNYIKNMVDNKRTAIYMKPYLFCNNCLNRDFDIVIDNKNNKKCPICGSKNIIIEDPLKIKN